MVPNREDSAVAYSVDQQKIINHGEGPGLVLAGPGSGKTHTLIGRFARLMDEEVSEDQVLLTTFTKAGALEMAKRVNVMVGRPEDVRVDTITTLHSFGYQLVRSHYKLLGYKSVPTVIEEDDIEYEIERIWEHRYSDELPVPQRYHGCLGEVPYARAWLKRYALSQMMMQDWSEQPDSDEALYGIPIPQEYSGLYDKKSMVRRYFDLAFDLGRELKSRCLIDFSMMIRLAVELLESDPVTAEMVQSSFKYVMVDEAQDLNPAHWRLVRAIMGDNHNNLMVIGDNDQAIYGWNGAEVDIMLKDFKASYPGASIYYLGENFRSTPQIVQASAKLIANNLERDAGKVLRAHVDKKDGPAPIAVGYNTPKDQYKGILTHLRMCRQALDSKWSDFAVLCRRTAPLLGLQELLVEHNIPCDGPGISRPIEKTIMGKLYGAMIRVVANPSDGFAFDQLTRRKRLGPWHLGPTHAAGKRMRATFGMIDEEALEKVPGIHGFKKQDAEYALELLQFVRGLRFVAEADVDKFLSVVRSHCERCIDSRARVQAEYLAIMHKKAMDAIKEYSDLAMWADLLVSGESDDDVVKLRTIHRVKGREFKHVLVIDASSSKMPLVGENVALEVAAIRRGESMAHANDRAEEEERRVCYVAATRAMESLIFTYSFSSVRDDSKDSDTYSSPMARWRTDYPSQYLTEMELRPRMPHI